MDEVLEAAVMPVTFKGTPPCDRVTAQFMVAHQACGEQPIAVHAAFTAPCDTKEQPYQRRIKLGPIPTPLDTGWCTTPGYVIIENRTGMQQSTNPTAEESARLAKHLILVLIGGTPVFSIPPGHAFIAHVEHPDNIHLCSNLGEGQANITAMPR